MRLCHVVPSLEAQYGGPSKSVLAISRALAQIGHPVELLSTAPAPVAARVEGSLTVEIFRRDRPAIICPSAGLRRRLRTLEIDAIESHGLWLRPLAYAKEAAAVRQIPLIAAPRGMMSPWAWNHHGLRKRLASLLVHPGALAAVAGWHATSEEEANDIRGLGFKAPICVAPNGVEEPDETEAAAAAAHWKAKVPEATHRPVVLFYSRLHSKKRVRELIELWSERAASPWILLIVGIPEEYTEDDLKTLARERGVEDSVRVFSGKDLPPPYSLASLFVLPSHNENFGMSIAEAMAHGVPVLVTDATPWAPVAAHGLGWCVPWSGFAAALTEALGEGPSRLRERGRLAQSWVLSEFSWARSAARLADFYRSLSLS